MNQVALLPEPENLTPMQMLQIAISKGVDTDQIKALMELQREWKADRAREAFVNAMGDFRAEAIKIVKSRAVKFGEETKYRYAALGDILNVVVPKLSEHGLSHRWETKQDGATITVTCVITHRDGHSESATLSASPDGSGGKNSIQAIGSAVAYLERYTFTAATGLAATDDDSVSAEKPTITESQVADLEALIEEVGANKERFLKYLKVDSLEQILARSYAGVVKDLERKRK